MLPIWRSGFSMVMSSSEGELWGEAGGRNRLLSLVLCPSAWSCGADEGVRSGASLACGGRGVKDSPPGLRGRRAGRGSPH